NDLSKYCNRGRFKTVGHCLLGDILECAGESFLSPGCCPANKGHWQIPSQTMLHHFTGDRSEAFHAHQHHLGAAKLRQCRVIDCTFSLCWILMSCKECYV